MKKIKMTISLLVPGAKIESKLQAVKLIKENSTVIMLKEAKQLIDSIDPNYTSEPVQNFEIEIPGNSIIQEIKDAWNEHGFKAEFNDRKRKMERLLYSDKVTLITTMLSDMGSWQNIVNKNDLENLTYN
jgi:hypothetical protein